MKERQDRNYYPGPSQNVKNFRESRQCRLIIKTGLQPIPGRIVSTMPIDQCSRCGGRNLVRGKLAGEVQFHPDEIAKFFSLTGGVTVYGVACLGCGTVHFEIDAEKLAKLTGSDRPGPREHK
jgi:hypothetical protein